MAGHHARSDAANRAINAGRDLSARLFPHFTPPAMRRAFAPFRLILATAFLGLAPLGARTLTSADGRAIEAEILGFEGTEKVRIKRADTGQTFTLPIDTFGEADAKALRAEAKEAAEKPAPPPGERDIAIELSRVRFDTRKTEEDIPLSNGGTARKAYVITDEDWGYSITLRNTTAVPIEKLRIEYLLYVKVDVVENTGRKPGLRRQAGKASYEALPANGRLTVKTSAITTRETELKRGLQWRGTNDDDTRDTLHGIWLRLYQGDKLISETASPATLVSEGRWSSASD